MHWLRIALRGEKGQIPCAFELRCDESRTYHLSHYLIQACWLILPAVRQTQSCSVYCVTGYILHVRCQYQFKIRWGEWCFVPCHNSCCASDFFLFSRREIRNHQVSVTNFRGRPGVGSCLGKSMFPYNTFFRENALPLILSSVNRAAAPHSPCTSPVSWGHWSNATPGTSHTEKPQSGTRQKLGCVWGKSNTSIR